MFVVCGKYENGILRVVDTNDWVVESITVEQLKLIQSIGYHVVFDERYDFIYKLWDTVVIGDDCKKHISSMCDIGFHIPSLSNIKLGIDIADSGTILFGSVFDTSYAVFTIHNVDETYKLSYKRGYGTGLHKNFRSFRTKFLSLEVGDMFSLEYSIKVDNLYDDYKAVFNYSCEYRGRKYA